MTEDLITRLTAAITADEEAARLASLRPGTPWRIAAEQPKEWGDPESDTVLLGSGKPVARFDAEYGGSLNAQHAERWGPDRVLRGCAADRRIVERHAPKLMPMGEWQIEKYGQATMCSYCSDENIPFYQPYPCPDIADLAERYEVKP